MKLIKSEEKNNMPQIEFYINNLERKELFEYVHSMKGKFLPDILFETPIPKYVNDSEEFMLTIAQIKTQFFIVSSQFEIFPLTLKQNPFISYPAFSVIHRFGGPYLNLSCYRGFSETDKVKYQATELHHYGKYINPEKRPDEFYATDELKQYYKMLVKFLKSKCKQISIDGKKFWVSKEVLKELNLAE
ncbi:MAG: hypothetical protein JNJ57_07350 [Saprospiraceae bacterium]|nr:hypothetical protein [Saprospiraceae bacterium]